MFSIQYLFIYLMAMQLLVNDGCTLQALERQEHKLGPAFTSVLWTSKVKIDFLDNQIHGQNV